jgi:hypothetical protein
MKGRSWGFDEIGETQMGCTQRKQMAIGGCSRGAGGHRRQQTSALVGSVGQLQDRSFARALGAVTAQRAATST